MRNATLLLLFFTYLFSPTQVEGQDDSLKYFYIHLNYGAGVPAVDMADRFGLYFIPGVGAGYRGLSGLGVDLTGFFGFGSKVKEDVLNSLRSREGFIFGRDQQPASILFRQRMGGVFLSASKNLAPYKKELHFVAEGGAGYLTHKVRIVDEFDSVVQLYGDSFKGYDRLTGGLALRQALTIKRVQRNELFNFFISLEVVEAFTKDLRKYNYNTGAELSDNRFDVLLNIKVGWVFPFFRNQGQIYY